MKDTSEELNWSKDKEIQFPPLTLEDKWKGISRAFQEAQKEGLEIKFSLYTEPNYIYEPIIKFPRVYPWTRFYYFLKRCYNRIRGRCPCCGMEKPKKKKVV